MKNVDNSVEAASKSNTRELIAFFFDSYELSEGNASLQERYFEILHELQPTWRIDDGQIEEIVSAVSLPIHRRVTGKSSRGGHNDTKSDSHTELGPVIRGELHRMVNALSRDVPRDEKGLEELFVNAAAQWVTVELKYLTREEGRSYSNMGDRNDPFYEDKFRSYIQRYLYTRDHSVASFREIIEALKPYLEKNGEFDLLVKKWEKHHAGEHFKKKLRKEKVIANITGLRT